MGGDAGRGWSEGMRTILSNCLFDLTSLILFIGEAQGMATLLGREISKERREYIHTITFLLSSLYICLFQ